MKGISTDICLAGMIEGNERDHGDSIAFIDGDRSLTHAALAKRARRLASGLAQRGCLAQDRIAVLSQNRIEYGEIYAANETGGFITTTGNFRLAAPEIQLIIADSAAKILIFEDRYAETVDLLRPALTSVDSLICIGTAPEWAEAYEAVVGCGDPAGYLRPGTGDDLAALIYTSGTTGKPKGCMLGQREMARKAQMLAVAMGISGKDRLILPMPMFHIGAKALQLALHWQGATVILERELRTEQYLANVERLGVTMALLAPTMLQMLLDSPQLGRTDISSLRHIHYSASGMPQPVLRRAIEVFGNIFQNGYGMTEGDVAVLHPQNHCCTGAESAQRKLRSVGTPYPGVDVRIVREDGRVAETGEVGEICFRGETMFRGYWNNSAATLDAFMDGFFRSGDIGHFREDGFLYLVDRKKDMIVSGGENIYSREVEDALLSHAAVRETAVIGIPDAKWGESVCAVVVPKQGAAADEEELIAHCRSLIGSYKKPRRVVFLDALPKLASGKIDKRELRAAFN